MTSPNDFPPTTQPPRESISDSDNPFEDLILPPPVTKRCPKTSRITSSLVNFDPWLRLPLTIWLIVKPPYIAKTIPGTAAPGKPPQKVYQQLLNGKRWAKRAEKNSVQASSPISTIIRQTAVHLLLTSMPKLVLAGIFKKMVSHVVMFLLLFLCFNRIYLITLRPEPMFLCYFPLTLGNITYAFNFSYRNQVVKWSYLSKKGKKSSRLKAVYNRRVAKDKSSL